jgi:ABC-type uncharacterized transport system permease subunit
VILAAHDLAALLYLIAALLGRASARTPLAERGASVALALGVLVHGVGFVGFHRLEPPVPLTSVPAALSLVGWLTAASYLLSLRVARIQSIARWVAALAFLLCAVGSIGVRVAPRAAESEAAAWSHTHVLLATAGVALLALASLMGAAYLAKERALKAHRAQALPLPSLESLDRIGLLALAVGWPLLTLGVASGALWASEHPDGMFTTHSVLSLIAWIAYLFPIGRRALRGERGAAPARALVFGFALLAVAYLGARSLGALL